MPSAAVQVAVHDMESRPAAEFDMLLRHKGTIRVASGPGLAPRPRPRC
ncbi:hypothetical protein I553_10831 [Mycobacterium xenopi 4042]|uniref:Uncharacterized protein n=1 Tax=Mycobacterium xenopi 4042 TaxID=1299334 RepID=X8DAY5_MYCXE|nr:hypothetical protein I553_10831 [Mycobacterium xenopi 4042]